jgi:D-alanyl-D-alanine carboxypeptidase
MPFLPLLLLTLMPFDPVSTPSPRRTQDGADATQLAARLQVELDRLREQSEAPGATLAIRAPNLIVELASGETGLRPGEAMTPRSRMAAGSVGKTFVAALALELVDAGKLDLEVPIATYLGDRDWLERLPNCHEPPAITVRMLMNHTSGLVRYEFDPRFTADLMQDPFRTWAVEEQLAYLFDREAPFPAGERFEYSDTNYLVLGLILKRKLVVKIQSDQLMFTSPFDSGRLWHLWILAVFNSSADFVTSLLIAIVAAGQE